jgi:hypothetical protein
MMAGCNIWYIMQKKKKKIIIIKEKNYDLALLKNKQVGKKFVSIRQRYYILIV